MDYRVFTIVCAMMAGAYAPAIVNAQNEKSENKPLYMIYAESYNDKTLSNDERASAAFNVAIRYSSGDDEVERNFKKAAEWYEKAYELGDYGSGTELGLMYYSGGFGLTQDFKEAAKWFKAASEHNQVLAMEKYGDMYYYGNGVTPDGSVSLKYYLWAVGLVEDAQRKDPKVKYPAYGRLCSKIANIISYDSTKKIRSDDKKALEWAKKSFEAGYMQGATTYAMLDNMVNGKQAVSRQTLLKASEKCYPLAIEKLVDDYIDGRYGPKNAVQAYVWASVYQTKSYSESDAKRVLEKATGALKASEKTSADKLAKAAVKKYEKVVFEMDHNYR